MHELMQVAGKPSTPASSLAMLLAVALLATAGAALAQAQRIGGPTPSGQGAEVYFIDLKDGATVPAKLKLYFGLRKTCAQKQPPPLTRIWPCTSRRRRIKRSARRSLRPVVLGR